MMWGAGYGGGILYVYLGASLSRRVGSNMWRESRLSLVSARARVLCCSMMLRVLFLGVRRVRFVGLCVATTVWLRDCMPYEQTPMKYNRC